MSIVRATDQPTELQVADHPVVVSDTAEHEQEPATAATTGVLNLTLHGAYTPDELLDGVVFKLKNYSLGDVPRNRVIVEEVGTTAIGSHAATNLMLSSNLFNTNGSTKHYLSSGVTNSHGWATVSDQESLVPVGYAPIVTLMPNEYCRKYSVHYEPSSGVDDKLVQRYGHLSSGENLRKGVVAFPGEDYYFVSKDHVVLDIIEKNWDTLGQSVPHERVREGNWIKVSKPLVERVLDELDTSVLKNMPLTDLNNLKFSLKADPELAEALDSSSAHPVTVSLKLKYRNVSVDES